MSTPFRLKRSAVSGKRPGLSDLQKGELALNFNDGYLFAERDTGGVGIGTTITLLTPWTENFGATSIYYENSVGIGTTNPTVTLDINGDVNVSGVSTFRDKVHLLDSYRLHFGCAAGDAGDLQIFHFCSCDWDRTKFTLDEDMTESVLRVFVDLYEKGLIYRGYRMVNWDPEAQTTLSDEEVIHEERQGKLYHIKYQVADSDQTITIATTRPETMLGDTAVAVHPEDERYKDLHGKQIIVPIANRKVPIITDTYVDLEFGTGCLKVTPAHDENDKALGDTHNLDVIDIFNPDGTLNAKGLHYEGQDRFVVRKSIAKELDAMGLLEDVKPHTHKVGLSERTKAVVEPRLSDQWFLRMEEIAAPALEAVNKGDVSLVPNKFINTYRHWMENIRDWNISRQLWWGQQIPAYYYGSDKQDFVVALDKESALEKARKQSGNPALSIEDLTQDPDVLDTWFSSWLWPITVFDGIRNPDDKEINYYYPTQDLVTGPDILFFWVARMIMSGYAYRSEKPFSKVYLTGLV